jgi:outer membrane biogenesis lipoprotein LolB
MIHNKVMFSSIFTLLLLTGCAVETGRRETPAAADEQRPGTKKDAYPTFTYRPGS